MTINEETLYFRFQCEKGLKKLFEAFDRSGKIPKWALKRFGEISLEQLKEKYRERFEFEFNVISTLGFAGYFLIVQDNLIFCRKNKIAVGPGRGSAAGCLCSYLLGLVRVDPVKYGLLFERFLNPERVGGLPDIDTDYSINARLQVKDYYAQKYGQDKTCSIGAFNTIKVRAAIKDIVRSLDLGGSKSDSFRLAETIAKTLEDEDDSVTYEQALENAQFKNYMERYPLIAKYAQQLEGIVRQFSMHAAGVIIAPEPLDNSIPLFVDKKGMVLSAYSGKMMEDMGYVKMDVLGLANLDIIEACKSNISKLHSEKIKGLRLDGIDFDPAKESEEEVNQRIDALPEGSLKQASKAYQLLRRGKTLGIFQCEQQVTADLLRRSRVNSIEEIADILSLIRPGPRKAGSTDIYISRKRKEEEIEYYHPHEQLPEEVLERLDESGFKERLIQHYQDYLEKQESVNEPKDELEKQRVANDPFTGPFGDFLSFAPKVCMWLDRLESGGDGFEFSMIDQICREHQGLPLFQEDLMKIAKQCAGFTAGEADWLRKGVGKKDRKIIKEVGEKFISGLIKGNAELNKEGVRQRLGQYLWYKFILPYGSYGFNCAHSISYGLVTYETAFLKANYPTEFYAALLCEEEDQERINLIIQEAKREGIKFLAPNVNQATGKFEILNKKTIVYALTLMKGVGLTAAEKIAQNAPYKSMHDFIVRSGVNKSVGRILIKGGAFENIFENQTTRKNYYDFYDDCSMKVKRQILRFLKDRVIRECQLVPTKEVRKINKDKTEEWITKPATDQKSIQKAFEDACANVDGFADLWDRRIKEEVERFQYDWENPVSEVNKTEVRAVERLSGDDRSQWTHSEVCDFEEEIYGTTITGHRLDSYQEYEKRFKQQIKDSCEIHLPCGEPLTNLQSKEKVELLGLVIPESNLSRPQVTTKRPYAKNPKEFTRRFFLEDRSGKVQIMIFDRDYQAIKKKCKDQDWYVIAEKGLGRSLLSLSCEVNEFNGRKSLNFKSATWLNEDEVIDQIKYRKLSELKLKEKKEEEEDD